MRPQFPSRELNPGLPRQRECFHYTTGAAGQSWRLAGAAALRAGSCACGTTWASGPGGIQETCSRGNPGNLLEGPNVRQSTFSARHAVSDVGAVLIESNSPICCSPDTTSATLGKLLRRQQHSALAPSTRFGDDKSNETLILNQRKDQQTHRLQLTRLMAN